MNAEAAPGFRVVLPGGVARFDRCPKAWLRDDAGCAPTLIEDWSRLDRFGVLPVSGGAHDQDPRFLAAVDIIEDERGRDTPKAPQRAPKAPRRRR